MCLSNISLLYSVAGLSDQECDVCPVGVNGASGSNLPTVAPSRSVHIRERTHLSHPSPVERHRAKIHDQDISHDNIFSTGNFPYHGNSVLIPFLFVSNLWPWYVSTATNGHWFCSVTPKATTWWWFSWLNLDLLLSGIISDVLYEYMHVYRLACPFCKIPMSFLKKKKKIKCIFLRYIVPLQNQPYSLTLCVYMQFPFQALFVFFWAPRSF